MASDVSIWVRVKDGFSTGLQRASKGFAGMAKRVLTSSRTYVAALAAITAAAAASVKQFAEFHLQMARVESLMGGRKQYGLRKEIMSLSSEVGIAKRELIDGLYNALSAGVPRDNAIAFLTKAARLAVADSSSVATAVDGMTTVINAFSGEMLTADKVANVMFKTVEKGKTTIEQLSSYFFQVAPLANASGVAFEEVAAALSTITLQGVPTAQAMTYLRALMIGLNKDLGDGWASTMSMSEALKDLELRTGNSSVALQKMGYTIEALQAINGLTGDSADIMAAQMIELANAMGTVEAASMGTADEARIWKKIGEEISNTAIKAGESITGRLMPALNSLLQSLRKVNDEGLKTPEYLNKIANAVPVLFSAKKQFESLFGKPVGPRAEKGVGRDSKNFPAKDEEQKKKESSLAVKLDEVAAKAKADQEKTIAEELAAKKAAIDKERSDRLREQLLSRSRLEIKALERIEKERARLQAAALSERRDGFARFAGGLADIVQQTALFKQDKALFKNQKPGERQRREEFLNRRQAVQDAAKSDAEDQKRLDRIAGKEARGIKISKEDRKFRDDVEAFRKAEKEAAKLAKDAAKVQTDIRDLLRQNLLASGGPA